jgi:signal transduction histidine kinase
LNDPRLRSTDRGAHAPDFAAGGGEMGARIQAHDWSATPLGPVAAWPQSLKTVVRIMLSSRYSMWMAWGPELTFFCNDAYLPTLGVKQAWALGVPAPEVWAEIWKDVRSRVETVLETGQATWDEALLLFLERSGYPEETYHTFSYSPLPDDDDRVAGMLCVVTEETERVIGERRLASLRELASELAGTNTCPEVLAAIERRLGTNLEDLPFTLTYLFEDGARARLACATGIAPGHAAAPAVIESTDATAWPVTELFAHGSSLLLDDLERRFGPLPTGAWDQPPRQAVVVPVARQGQERPAGFLVAGINPYRRFDTRYAGFVELIAGQIAAGLANAGAYENERRRAEALAEIDRAKTTFFSNVSHEFRTPLTLMLGPLEEVLDRPEGAVDAYSRARADTAHRNALRLLKLVNSLLDFSRIEAGRVQASYEPTDLSALTAELASNFRSAMDRAGLRLTIDCAPLPGPAHVDREMWEKIVLNLLSNAFKFTFEGEIAVTVRPSADGAAAELVVRDTGTGIPEAELPHLFERFHRVEGARGRSFEGSGIGLALVQELVRLHGGAIRVESTLGAGSAFTVTLPLGTAHLPADRLGGGRAAASTAVRAEAYVEEALRWLPDGGAADPSADAPSLSAPDDLGVLGAAADSRERVLLADDNADMRNYVRRLLVAEGYRVEAVADGEAALAAARREPPDLVLSDVMMPRLDGFGLLRALRAEPDLRDVPVLLLSARAGEEARLEGLNVGADDYLTKPFSARELLARVRSNLKLAHDRRQSARALEEQARTLEARVAERTAELAAANRELLAQIEERERIEDALRHARKMEIIGQLTGGVAHDFNNLLTIILGNLETLQRQLERPALDAARLQRSADNAARGAERAAALTQRLLAFSRRQPLEPRALDVNRLVGAMSDLLRRTLGERIAVETVLAGGLWPTHADPNQLESAILNLALNARDAMPGGGRLTIETAHAHLDEAYTARQSEVAPGQYVVVAVTDSGVGMSREVIGQAFEPFFTTKDAGHGTGLGLSQVYGFVKQSGGHVSLYSEPGQGTTVKVYLPRLHGAQELVEQPEHGKMADADERSPTVLVVEDDDDVRAHSAAVLEELGYRVLEAPNGPSALEILERQPEVALLFTDVGLPGGMNGRQLAEEACRRRPGLRVLFTTGYAKNAIVHEGRLDPGVQLITKPFSFEGLGAKVRDLLEADAGPPRVLVIEDEALVRMVAVDALEALGFRVEAAATATEAINKLRLLNGRIDAAIIDIGLPDRRGDALAVELRALHARLPIVIASGYRDPELMEGFADGPALGFIGKPYDSDALAAALAAVGVAPPAAA